MPPGGVPIMDALPALTPDEECKLMPEASLNEEASSLRLGTKRVEDPIDVRDSQEVDKVPLQGVNS